MSNKFPGGIRVAGPGPRSESTEGPEHDGGVGSRE